MIVVATDAVESILLLFGVSGECVSWASIRPFQKGKRRGREPNSSLKPLKASTGRPSRTKNTVSCDMFNLNVERERLKLFSFTPESSLSLVDVPIKRSMRSSSSTKLLAHIPHRPSPSCCPLARGLPLPPCLGLPLPPCSGPPTGQRVHHRVARLTPFAGPEGLRSSLRQYRRRCGPCQRARAQPSSIPPYLCKYPFPFLSHADALPPQVSRAGLPPSPCSPRAWPSPPLCLCVPCRLASLFALATRVAQPPAVSVCTSTCEARVPRLPPVLTHVVFATCTAQRTDEVHAAAKHHASPPSSCTRRLPPRPPPPRPSPPRPPPPHPPPPSWCTRRVRHAYSAPTSSPPVPAAHLAHPRRHLHLLYLVLLMSYTYAEYTSFETPDILPGLIKPTK
ncbi:hypothetical protein BC826DRAFT_146886 [Russula brevipes]|nr:hypothetical protein BC826DRAFT_146886 [Russula brevipes]